MSGLTDPLAHLEASSRVVDDLLMRCEFPPAGSRVVCGVSGGADSAALLVLACVAGLDATAVHVDHGLRPGSADESARVAALAKSLGAGFECRPVTIDDGPNLEARARQARLLALGEGALLGHTADDQAETVLINLARGAGPDGLAGMRRGGAHPILGLRRSETEALCRELGIDVVTDPSNRDPRFVRNRMRHELLPLLDDIAGRDSVPLLVRSAEHSRSLVDGVAELADALDASNTAALRKAPPVVARAALRSWLRTKDGHPPSTAELDRAWRVVVHEWRAAELSGGRRLSRRNGVLRVQGQRLSASVSVAESESLGGSVV